MRAIGAVLIVIAILAVGFVGLSYMSQSVEDTALNSSNASADAYNITNQVQETGSETLVPALIVGGVASAAIVTAGLLLTYGPRGR